MKRGTSIRYWDSCCFLGWFMKEPDKHTACQGVLSEAEKGNLKIVTSALTFIEVIKLKGKTSIDKDNQNLIERFFQKEFIIVRNVDREMGRLGRDLIWNHGVDTKDAIHIATALYHEVTIFDTFDDGLIKLDGKFTNPVKLRIGKPDVPFEPDFDHALDEKETTKA